MDLEEKEQLELCAVHLSELKGRRFFNKTITYFEETVHSKERLLNYLVSVTISKNHLILGFHEKRNYKIRQEPRLSDTNQSNITFIDIVSKDKEVSFVSLDFSAEYFLFADKLNNGIAFYKTNARRSPETKVTKSRWLFREEFICDP